MPAIQLARLKQQAAQIASAYAEPQTFLRALHHLLNFYANRSRRFGQSGEPNPLLPAYNVPTPVLRQIVLELTPYVAEDPPAGLALCDLLWSQETLECRSLAASLIGAIPLQPPNAVLERLQTWTATESNDKLLTTLFKQGFSRLLTETQELYLKQATDWLSSPRLHNQMLGLRAMNFLLNEPSFENLPLVFKYLTPLVRVAPKPLRPYLISVLSALVKRSPQETAFFLRQNLRTPKSVDTSWLIRQIWKEFPVPIQDSLREDIRE
jgi:hypothetical protein